MAVEFIWGLDISPQSSFSSVSPPFKKKSHQAFMKGKLKIKGNMGMAMKLESILKLARTKAKL